MTSSVNFQDNLLSFLPFHGDDSIGIGTKRDRANERNDEEEDEREGEEDEARREIMKRKKMVKRKMVRMMVMKSSNWRSPPFFPFLVHFCPLQTLKESTVVH